jgi:hypothetical protein
MRVGEGECGFQDIVKRKHIRMIPGLMKAAMLSERSGPRSCIPAVNRLDRSVPGYVRSEYWSLRISCLTSSSDEEVADIFSAEGR